MVASTFLVFSRSFLSPKKIGIVAAWHFLRWKMESRVTSDTAALTCLCLPWSVLSQVCLPKSVGQGNCAIVIAGEECHPSSHELGMWWAAPETAVQLSPEKACTIGVPVLLGPPRPITNHAKLKGWMPPLLSILLLLVSGFKFDSWSLLFRAVSQLCSLRFSDSIKGWKSSRN